MIRDDIVGASDCMRTYGIRSGDVLVVDTEAPIRSGDIVRIKVPGSWMIKQLVSDGHRWFLLCSDGLALISHYACTPIAEPQKVIAVRHEGVRYGLGHQMPEGVEAGPEAVAHYASLIGQVDGFVEGLAWPGVAAAVTLVEPDTEGWKAMNRRRDVCRQALAALPPGASVLEMNRAAVRALGDEARGQLPPQVPRFELPDLTRRAAMVGALAAAASACGGNLHVPAHAQEPTTNPTRPSAPASFSLRTIAGAIEFEWAEGAVIPRGTQYQVIATPNSANAAVGTVAWQGTADRVTLPWPWMPNSPHWFHVRAVSGLHDYQSAYVPATFGLLGIPPPAPNQMGWPIPDPQLQAGMTVGSYWALGALSAGGTIQGSGGLTPRSGVFQYVANPSSASQFCRLFPSRAVIPGPPDLFTTFPIGGGRTINASVTFRRTTTLAGSGSQAGFELLLDVGADGVGYGPAINSGDSYIRCDTVGLNTWVTRIASARIQVNSGCDSAEASLRFNSSLCSSGTIEVGRFDVALF